ncbi:hypothetical protein SO802_009729 [Lithocarpus litseifolius]|uniref:F-box associated beta-propeller type 3 domain-containing protein n=1 Tax=Lithocarpus litseifolius TaxID=425828 RepID=A0AAW2DC94_9ROSI
MLSSDSWKRVEVGTSSRPDFEYSVNFVSGHLHWMIDRKEKGGGQEENFNEMILSFDVNCEKFREPPSHLDDFNKGDCHAKGLTSLKGKLALIQLRLQPSNSFCCFRWVIKEYGVLESWNKISVVPIDDSTHFICLNNYGLLLIHKRPPAGHHQW